MADVDTSAKVETPAETEVSAEQKFAEYSKKVADTVLAGLPASLEEEDKPVEPSEPAKAEEEPKAEEPPVETSDGQETEDEPIKSEVEFEVDGKTVKLDLTQPEQLEKAKIYLRNGYKTENIHDAKVELENQTRLLNQVYFGNQMLYLRNVVNGEVPFEEPIQKDYLDENGKYYYQYDDDDKRKKAYKDIKKNYDTISVEKINYENALRQSYPVYVNTVKSFAERHPDVENVNKWIVENIDPIVSSVLSVGAMSIPQDLFEAIYFYRNKDSILSKAIEQDRKKMATKTEKAKPKATVIKQDVQNVNSEEAMKDKIFPMTGGSKVKFKFR